ncbi:MAG: dockerin type I repeat-containing protein [Candidatus Doudnabacteria bacterium]|nr:dockerin type I repeat-containing protein [Candidatus Doudnabacteria bacterium]
MKRRMAIITTVLLSLSFVMLYPTLTYAAFDLDVNSDNIPDTSLSLKTCAGGGLCLDVSSNVVASRQIQVASQTISCPQLVPKPTLVGNYVGTAVSEAVVYYCQNQVPFVSIVDINAGTVAATTTSPQNKTNFYWDMVRDSSGKNHPFLANGYADDGSWGYLCVYKPSVASSAECGSGFVRINTVPQNTSRGIFRNFGGFTQDLDGDGWEDINLMYEFITVTVSANTQSIINQIDFDIAAATEPGSPLGFHSGRQYGEHIAVTGADGKLRDLMIGGIPVGSFTDPFCNVSRFVGVLESNPGQAQSRTLKWSKYLGFHSTIFSTTGDPALVSNPPISRPADMMNRCIMLFSDGRTKIGTNDAIIFNYFIQEQPVSNCVYEQYQLTVAPVWTTAKDTAWNNCIAQNLKSKGNWAMAAYRQSDGVGLTASGNNYIWGMSDKLIPSGQMIYLTEILPTSVTFDLSDRPLPKLEARTIDANGFYGYTGTFPVSARPKIQVTIPEKNRGMGAGSYFAELTTQDLDFDGLLEVQLENGQWVGYSSASNSFVVKTPNTLPRGNVDSVTNGVVTGWNYDPDSPTLSLTTTFFMEAPAETGGVFAGYGTINLPRSDVNQTYGITGNHGFSFNLPPQYKDGNAHKLYVYGIDTSFTNQYSLLTPSPISFVWTATTSPTSYERTVSVSSLEGLANKTLTGVITVLDASKNLVKSYPITTNSSGSSIVTFDIPAQTGYLQIKAAPFLAKNISVDLNSNVTYSFPALTTGDINQDNIINSVDFSTLNSKWFTNNSASDLNTDGIVNGIDFSLLNKNWFVRGD